MSQNQHTEKIKIYVYEIHNMHLSVLEPNLSKDLFKCLNNTTSARERLMPLELNNQSSPRRDFISMFISNGGFLFGSFARLSEGEQSSVSKEILDKKTVSLNEMIMEAEANIEGAIKDSAFFCIYKSLFAITKKNLVKPIETYINWIMNNQMNK